MTTHPLSQWLSDYLDGELSPPLREELERHLEGCAECSATLAELRRVVTRARALEDRPPRGDLWPDVAAAIGAASGPRRLSFTLPQLLAAGIALVLLSGGAAWLAFGGRTGAVLTETPRPVARLAAVSEETEPARGYDHAVRELERVLVEHKSRLDTTTVRVLEEKLALIDRAITEAERALAADPASTYLHEHLAETRMRKLQLLRRAAELTRAAS